MTINTSTLPKLYRTQLQVQNTCRRTGEHCSHCAGGREEGGGRPTGVTASETSMLFPYVVRSNYILISVVSDCFRNACRYPVSIVSSRHAARFLLYCVYLDYFLCRRGWHLFDFVCICFITHFAVVFVYAPVWHLLRLIS